MAIWKKKYFYDEKLIILIKDKKGRVLLELPGQTIRETKKAMQILNILNKE